MTTRPAESELGVPESLQWGDQPDRSDLGRNGESQDNREAVRVAEDAEPVRESSISFADTVSTLIMPSLRVISERLLPWFEPETS